MLNYELDNLKREVSHLQFQKADQYKLDNLESLFRNLNNRIVKLENEKSYLEERVYSIEQKEQEYRMNLEKAEEFNKEVREAINNETYDEFLEKHGLDDAWEVLEHLIKLLYN